MHHTTSSVCSTEGVPLFRLIGSLVLIGALSVAAGQMSDVTSSLPPTAAPCSEGAILAPFTGPQYVTLVARYDCVGNYGYLWATIGTGARAVSVTEVVVFDEQRRSWSIANRSVVCSPSVLPPLIYRQGCFSN